MTFQGSLIVTTLIANLHMQQAVKINYKTEISKFGKPNRSKL